MDVSHTQSTASNRWLLTVNQALPFNGWVRNVESIHATSQITNAGNTRITEMPWVQAAVGTARQQVAVNWGTAVRGSVRLRLRMDNPD